MQLHLRAVLTPAEVREARHVLETAPWEDGRATAGVQASLAKYNQQLPETCEATQRVQQMVLRGLERHPEFFSATLPKQISPPLFNRYAPGADRFDNHVDSAVRFLRNGVGRVRTDISCTLFLAGPDEYDGGDLVIEDVAGARRVKLPAGDMVVYPATTVHRVEPVTRGARIGAFFWIQSMVRSDEQRRLLYDMDGHLRELRSRVGEADPAVVGLTGTYHNLLRLWADV
jgi:PKHD-type hydroxylase